MVVLDDVIASLWLCLSILESEFPCFMKGIHKRTARGIDLGPIFGIYERGLTKFWGT